MSRTEIPDTREMLNRSRRETGLEMNCVSIGTIEEFNVTTQRATVSINYKRIVRDNFGNEKAYDYAPLLQCLVMSLTGGIGAITLPITKGDSCLVLFCDRDIDNWIDKGVIGVPNSTRIHDMNDAIVIVGIRSSANVIQNYNLKGIELKGPAVYIPGNLKLDMGVSGSFTAGGQTIVVTNGIITSII